MSTPKWAVGMRRLGPGVYVQDGALHIDAAGICEHLGWTPTEANLRIAEQAAVDTFQKAYGQFPVTRIDHSDADPS